MAEATYRLRVPKHLRHLISGLHPELKTKVRASLLEILADPFSGKALRDELEGLRGYRVSRFRIIYRIAARGRIVELVAIGPRARIYADTLRVLRRKRHSR